LSQGPVLPAPEFRMAIVADVAVALPSQFPTVVLRETEAPRRQLSFSVGMQDGVGLSHALRRVPTPRPLTHELITDVLSGFDIDVIAIRLVGRQGKTYFAELDLRGRTGRNVYSCRPTDALAVALHQAVPVPILIDSRLFEEEGDVVPWSPPPVAGGAADGAGEATEAAAAAAAAAEAAGATPPDPASDGAATAIPPVPADDGAADPARGVTPAVATGSTLAAPGPSTDVQNGEAAANDSANSQPEAGLPTETGLPTEAGLPTETESGFRAPIGVHAAEGTVRP
jgi:bifunctional DNase/RNase